MIGLLLLFSIVCLLEVISWLFGVIDRVVLCVYVLLLLFVCIVS